MVVVDDDDGSEVSSKGFADSTSLSKVGIAKGVTATVMIKMRMIDSMHPLNVPQTYILDHQHEKSHFRAHRKKESIILIPHFYI